MTWTSPDPWHCYQCGAEGLGGRPAFDVHTDSHAPTPEPPLPPAARGVVPEGIDPADVRAWARANGWPALGDRGRLPQAAIDAYLNRPSPARPPRIDLDVVDDMRGLGYSSEQIAHRFGVTVEGLARAEARRRRA